MKRMPTLPLNLAAFTAATVLTLTAAAATPASGGSASGLDLKGIDRTVAPGDDFFRYANGTWIAATEIPPDRSAWGAGEIVDELTRKRTSDLIQGAAKGAPAHSEAFKVGTYYAAYMDEAAIESAGLTPLQPQLARIDAIKDLTSLARVLGSTLRADVDVLNSTNLHTENLFGLWVAQDLNDPKRYLPFLLQGGLVMPDRDYYLDDSQKMADIRLQFPDAHHQVLMLAQIDPAAARRRRASLTWRSSIAQVPLEPRADSEQVHKGNNHWQIAEFATAGAGPGLGRLFRAPRALASRRSSSCGSRAPLTGIAALTSSVPLRPGRIGCASTASSTFALSAESLRR